MHLQTGQCVEGLVQPRKDRGSSSPGRREPLVGGGQGDV